MVVNLDDMSTEPRDYFVWAQYHGSNSRTIAAELFPTKPARYVRVTRDLANYASNKGTALACRARGDIPAAQVYEGICERIYAKLPAYARW